MRVGILGTGVVARTLAGGCLKHGHEVTLGTRDPGKLTEWRKQHPEARVGTGADAASTAEVVVLAVKGTAASDALRLAGAANLDGKVIIDTTNPIADAPPDHGVLRFFTSLDDSDALVRQRIGLLSSNRLVSAWLGTKGLVRNFTVVLENISHGVNPSRHLGVLKPAGQFRVTTRGANVVIDPRNSDRFNPIADAASSIDAAAAGRLYRSFKPLLQMAYDELGNQESIDRAVERAIGGLLQVPAADGDLRVEQAGEGIGYEYADPRLEALNGAQKQLLRMGPRNIRAIQQQLRGFASAAAIPLS